MTDETQVDAPKKVEATRLTVENTAQPKESATPKIERPDIKKDLGDEHASALIDQLKWGEQARQIEETELLKRSKGKTKQEIEAIRDEFHAEMAAKLGLNDTQETDGKGKAGEKIEAYRAKLLLEAAGYTPAEITQLQAWFEQQKNGMQSPYSQHEQAVFQVMKDSLAAGGKKAEAFQQLREQLGSVFEGILIRRVREVAEQLGQKNNDHIRENLGIPVPEGKVDESLTDAEISGANMDKVVEFALMDKVLEPADQKRQAEQLKQSLKAARIQVGDSATLAEMARKLTGEGVPEKRIEDVVARKIIDFKYWKNDRAKQAATAVEKIKKVGEDSGFTKSMQRNEQFAASVVTGLTTEADIGEFMQWFLASEQGHVSHANHLGYKTEQELAKEEGVHPVNEREVEEFFRLDKQNERDVLCGGLQRANLINASSELWQLDPEDAVRSPLMIQLVESAATEQNHIAFSLGAMEVLKHGKVEGFKFSNEAFAFIIQTPERKKRLEEIRKKNEPPAASK